MIAGSVLGSRGINVLSAINTVQADAILHREKVDVIICDVMMPKEDGLAYSERLRREGSKIPLMLLSALSDKDTVSRGIRSGAAAYLIKPFDLQELHRRLLTLTKNLRPVAPSQPDPDEKKPTWKLW
jgi:DNA-binding response OmpR family regulator